MIAYFSASVVPEGTIRRENEDSEAFGLTFRTRSAEQNLRSVQNVHLDAGFRDYLKKCREVEWTSFSAVVEI